MKGKKIPKRHFKAEATRLLNETPSPKGELPPCKLSARDAPKSPQIIKVTATAVGYMTKLEGKTLLLKTPHARAVTVGNGEAKCLLDGFI